MHDCSRPLRLFTYLNCILLIPACSSTGNNTGLGPPPATQPVSTPPPASPQEKPALTVLPASQQPRRSLADDTEYRANYFAAEAIGALYALDSGYTGQGVLVGVMDNGVAVVPELAGQISSLSRDFGSIRHASGEYTARGVVGDERSDHGTPVAAIIAARDDGTGVQGLAPNTQIVSLRVDYQLADGSMALGQGMADALRYAADSRVPIVNRSIGRSVGGGVATDFAAAVDYFSAKGGLLVQSTGNDGAPEPTEAAEVTAVNRTGWLFVSALLQQGDGVVIAPFANACGTMMDRCVVAIGENITQGVNGDLMTFTGTSSAAPQASALAAMILSKWPHLSGVDAGNIILRTTRDLGERGIDSIYGAGLIDVQAALSPINPTLSNGTVATALDGSRMMVSSAFGLAGIQSSLGSAIVLDEFGRDFATDLSRLVSHQLTAPIAFYRSTTTPQSLVYQAQRLSLGLEYRQPAAFAQPQQLAAARFRWQAGSNILLSGAIMPDGSGMPFLESAGERVGLSALLGNERLSLEAFRSDADERLLQALALTWERGDSFLRLGVSDERGAVFGVPTGTGPLRFADGARTVFITGGARAAGENWFLEAQASLGLSRLKLADDLLLREADLIVSGQFGFTAQKHVADGWLSLSVSQPVVVGSGAAIFRLPVAYDRGSRSLVYEDRRADLRDQLNPRLAVSYDYEGRIGLLNFSAIARPCFGEFQALASWSAALGIVD